MAERTKSGNQESEAQPLGIKEVASSIMDGLIRKAVGAKRPQMDDPRLVFNSRSAEVVKGTQKESSGWIHAPANLALNVTADDRLSRVSAMLGTPVTRVLFVRAALVKGTKKVFIVPADPEDRDRIEVVRNQKRAWINLVELLAPLGLTVPTGYQYEHTINYAEEGDPLYPALVLDLALPLTKQPQPKRKKSKKEKAATKPSPAPAPTPTPGDAPTPEARKEEAADDVTEEKPEQSS